MKESKLQGFPFRIFALYVLFYSGQSIYNTYLNLYLDSVGLSESQIGVTVSVSTVGILIAQVFWGMVSDRAKSKNRVLLFLYAVTALVSLMFYLNHSFWFLLVAVTLFAIFFNPLVPLQDNFSLEYLEGKKWDYGQVRMGGTIGYCITVLSIGFLLQDGYKQIFWMVALGMTVCFLICAGLPKIEGYRKQGNKSSYKELIKNKPLVGMILFNMIFSIGLNFYYNFYTIYFTSDKIGGNSSMVGIMMFISAVSEIPMLMLIHKITEKIGIRKTLITAAFVTSLRWLLLFLLTEPIPIIVVNLMHGIGYTSFSYCIITYIGKTVPKDMRATGQTMNVLIGNVISKVLFGFVGGFASENLGANKIMLFAGIMMMVGTVVFGLWSRGIKELKETID